MFTIHPSRSSGALRSSAALVISAVAILLVLSFGMQRAGAQVDPNYPPPTDPPATTIVVVPEGGEDPTPGGTVELVADGFKPGTEVDFYVIIDGVSVLIGTAIADENGNATFDWTIPAGVCCGEFEIEVEGIDEETGEPRKATTSLVIVESNNGGGGELPYTGSNSSTLIRIGFVLVLAGGVSVMAVRRRSARTVS